MAAQSQAQADQNDARDDRISRDHPSDRQDCGQGCDHEGDRNGKAQQDGKYARQGEEPLAFDRSEEHTSELQSLMRISYAVFCLKKKKIKEKYTHTLKRKNNTSRKH